MNSPHSFARGKLFLLYEQYAAPPRRTKMNGGASVPGRASPGDYNVIRSLYIFPILFKRVILAQ